MKTKILIVDDLRENIVALSRLIEASDVELFTTATPYEALGLILDHDFGLALLDVQMPVMTGFELARLIRSVEKGRHLPIIFVTAQASESSLIFEGYESGAVDVLFKPLDPHIVRSKVKVFVQLDQQSRLLHEQVETMSKLKQEADAANVAKSRFLANMSHEIRTPLSAVLGFADILSQSDLAPEERSDYLASISRNGKLLLRIIDDILDLSRIEAQKLELDQAEFDLGELLRDLEMTLGSKATDKGIELAFAKSDDLIQNIVSDSLRIKQILLNIIGNAIKFTEKGSIKISVESTLLSGFEYYLRFVIEDTGIGLSQEEASRLFAPFAQADNSTRRKYGGTGLGLVISKQLAKSMGGSLTILSSEKGVGSVFAVELKVIEAAPKIVPAGSSVQDSTQDHGLDTNRTSLKLVENVRIGDGQDSLSGKRILVVDDVTDNRVLIERYLRPSGAYVELASGGQEAIDRARVGDWDVVLMDIQMPNMDGYEATSRLRRLGFKKPIIAVTAHAMREELDRCVKAGCNTTMTKPVTRKNLVETLKTILG
jgi:signal transduction histidine kinase